MEEYAAEFESDEEPVEEIEPEEAEEVSGQYTAEAETDEERNDEIETENENIPAKAPVAEEEDREKSILRKAAGLMEQENYLVAYNLFRTAAQNMQNPKYAELQMLDCLVKAGQMEDASRMMFGFLNKKYDLTAQEKFRLKEIMTILHNADRQNTV